MKKMFMLIAAILMCVVRSNAQTTTEYLTNSEIVQILGATDMSATETGIIDANNYDAIKSAVKTADGNQYKNLTAIVIIVTRDEDNNTSKVYSGWFNFYNESFVSAENASNVYNDTDTIRSAKANPDPAEDIAMDHNAAIDREISSVLKEGLLRTAVKIDRLWRKKIEIE